MSEPLIRFEDGASYEDFMGKWSRLAGDVFLNWLRPQNNLRWVDVGCGNGAFTQMLVDGYRPRSIHGIDPSSGQLDFARKRLPSNLVTLQQGDAMALPYRDQEFDAATMALVIFFVPDPAKGVTEMVRVVKPGGSVSAYAWDILGGGFPFAAMQEEMDRLGSPSLWSSSIDASRLDKMHELWKMAGLIELETRVIEVERTFEDFETFWNIARSGPAAMKRIGAMTAGDAHLLKARLRDRMTPGADGRIVYGARANAIKGTVA